MGAHPMGAPGWPLLASCTISAHSVRIVLMHLSSASSVSPLALAFFADAEAALPPARLDGLMASEGGDVCVYKSKSQIRDRKGMSSRRDAGVRCHLAADKFEQDAGLVRFFLGVRSRKRNQGCKTGSALPSRSTSCYATSPLRANLHASLTVMLRSWRARNAAERVQEAQPRCLTSVDNVFREARPEHRLLPNCCADGMILWKSAQDPRLGDVHSDDHVYRSRQAHAASQFRASAPPSTE